MVRRMLACCTVLLVASCFGVFKNITPEKRNALNPAEHLIYQYVTKEISRDTFTDKYIQLMRRRYSLHPEDVRIKLQNGTIDKNLSMNFNNQTENGYIPTDVTIETDKTAYDDPRLRFSTCLRTVYDIDHALAKAKHFVSLKRKHKMHPRISRAYNETGKQHLYNALQHHDIYMLTKQHLRYPDEIPSGLSINEKHDIDADLMVFRRSLVPGLMLRQADIGLRQLQQFARDTNSSKIYEQYAPHMQRQYIESLKAYHRDPDRETLCKHL